MILRVTSFFKRYKNICHLLRLFNSVIFFLIVRASPTDVHIIISFIIVIFSSYESLYLSNKYFKMKSFIKIAVVNFHITITP